MKIKECLAIIEAIKPHKFSDSIIVGWLSDLDQQIWAECLSWHKDTGVDEMPERYDSLEDLDEDLLVPDPYSELYPTYIGMKIDYAHGEYGRYNNSMVAFNTQMSTFQDWVNRNYLPIDKRVRVWR